MLKLAAQYQWKEALWLFVPGEHIYEHELG